MKPYYANGHTVIYNTNFTLGLCELADESVKCIVTSPPLNWDEGCDLRQEVVPYTEVIVLILEKVRRVLRPDGVVFWHQSDATIKGQLNLTPHLLAWMLRINGWFVQRVLIWDKMVIHPEYILIFTKNPMSSLVPDSIWRQPQEPYGIIYCDDCKKSTEVTESVYQIKHCSCGSPLYRFSAVMPLNIAEKCIEYGSSKGDTVLDFFAGTGTTGVAAQNLGRETILIEGWESNCKIARNRIK